NFHMVARNIIEYAKFTNSKPILRVGQTLKPLDPALACPLGIRAEMAVNRIFELPALECPQLLPVIERLGREDNFVTFIGHFFSCIVSPMQRRPDWQQI